MAHEVTATDSVLYHGKAAWHGLGQVIDNAESVTVERVRREALPWDPIPAELTVTAAGTTTRIDSHKAICRSDSGAVLGVVSQAYNIVTNEQLLRIAEGVTATGCQVETAGSLRGGKRIWILMRDTATDFAVAAGDEQRGYMLITAGHDGTAAVSVLPTTIRVECMNRLRLALSTAQTQFTTPHTSDAAKDTDRMIADAIACVRHGREVAKEYATQARRLSFVPLTDDQRRRLNEDIYAHIWGAIPLEDGQARSRAVATLADMDAAIEHPTNRLPYMRGTAWAALNAVTLHLNHGQRTRGDRAGQIYCGNLGRATNVAYARTLEFVGAL